MRSSAAGSVERALLPIVAPHAPVPRLWHFSPDNPLTGHPYALLEWVDGQRLEVVAPTLPDDDLAALGQLVGAALAGVHRVIFPRTGFFDANLDVAQPISVGGDALLSYLRLCLVDGRGGARLGETLTADLLGYVEREGRLLDTWNGPPCLVHGDFGGSNILVRQTSARWGVAAVLDWEFAFSGSPFFDLGNLLRPPLGDRPSFSGAVHAGYTAAGGQLPAQWPALSRLADLLSWADFLNRPETGEQLIHDARTIIRRTIAGA